MNSIKKIVVQMLTLESRLILAKYKPFIVAVTGSVGKTSTKDAVYAVLKNKYNFARKSEKSLNSEIGLPLTVIGAPNAWHSMSGWISNIIQGFVLMVVKKDYPNCLVLEVGADHPGDIRKAAKWLKPDIAVITKISKTPVHVEFFDSPEQVFEEKMALAKAVKDGGSVVLFADDERMAAYPRWSNSSVLTFGENKGASVRGFDYEVYGVNEGLSFKINFDGRVETVKLKGAIGRQQMYPLLAAAAVGKAKGLSVDEILRGLYDYEPAPGRMRILEGVNGSTVIDDSYNSSPDAAFSALMSLKDAKCGGRRIAVLGDMMELGKYSGEEHRKLGREAVGCVDILVTIGPRARAVAEEALKGGMAPVSVKQFDSSVSAAPFVSALAGAGDVILVKGSQAPRLEYVTKALLKNHEKAAKLLVRQEAEWLKRGPIV
ncbi:UDP-N-acetylmuramoyl-tripeptide--D-alanyl-D-alanine ligase [Patescibacteria group bacterium]|nr:UDP-N-acetylmuramoyl-tripeptide--D-alanyl-D-alanine ligase [Patescibacteria group bacterium]MDE1946303.1 UDP-N-acetylmuramoyl-tripeptide--D-alanyl-D-alanine ligase [Patescibacteria group bacterium]MDE2010755.1 UDP-N-acetylmuramoyl-tripeptide--D-alanyl-D-alanine ligase [Patescibacteria group bacterium]MDE2232639.1 UDP-N-acetylmuramoyl-tripeptide--D-alanyl-D-alanine ligase [Patescibacteria group bacterium]